ncbi:hypothetical protein RJ53_05490 [Methanocalculus chunghsingensis]|uniref:Peptidase C45 hydrolase domain-containing protein n=1 Tax=Methanocalculus chunghsingensis TaxID=156457 RepID=A0A8J8B5D2_9EURY|nr:C45 family peptidase [Methanocalculus chunghsingensis]MBR1368983.1 hypothetical protein [Methanocalculus chunghsingensis]
MHYLRILPPLLLVLILALSAGCTAPDELVDEGDQQVSSGGEVPPDIHLSNVRAFEGGQAYRTGSDLYHVLHLSGSWMEMGRQYGGLVGDELRLFHDEIVDDITSRGIDEADQIREARKSYDGYSPELQELLGGISQTSGLSMDEVLVLNAGMMLLTDAILEGDHPGACSGVGVWDGYTGDGTLVFGRNWDIQRESMQKYMRYLSVVVYHPEEGYPVANIHPLGNVYLETGMNSEGLFIELNNGGHSDPVWYPEREDTSSVLIRVLTESRTVDEAVRMLENTPADLSYILQIADPSHAVSLERATFDTRVRPSDDDGLVVAVNHFIPDYPPHWEGIVAPPRPASVDPRYDNLIRMAQSEEYRGHFTPDLMMQLLEIPIEEGGATFGGTVYQVVAVPETRTIWLRAIDHADWEEIPLAPLFG